MDAHELIESVKESSEGFATTLGPNGDWAPMLFVAVDERLAIALIDPEFLGEKERFWTSVVPSIAHEISGGSQPEACAFLSSAWVVKVDMLEQPDFNIEGTVPSEHPDRIECLTIFGLDRESEAGATAEIIRGDEHPVLEWDVEAEHPGLTFEGDLVSSLRRAMWG